MSRSVIANHPFRAEIEQAIREGQPVRQIGRRFSIDHTVVHKYRHKLLAGTPPKEEPDLSLPVRVRDRTKRGDRNADRNSNASPQHLHPDQPELDYFDLLGMPRFPWATGEAPRPDPVAQQLRDQQRRFGIEHIRRSVLALVADNAAVLSDASLAQKLDVEPEAVARWREILIADATSGATKDPVRGVAEDLLTLETIKRACLRRLTDSRTSDSALLASIDRILRTMREARDLKEAHGLVRPIPVQEVLQPDDPYFEMTMGAAVLKRCMVLLGDTLGVGDEVEDAIRNDGHAGKVLLEAMDRRVAEKAVELSAEQAEHSTAAPDPEGEPDDDGPETGCNLASSAALRRAPRRPSPCSKMVSQRRG